jgi:predicted dienelactone hydrolase
MSRFLTLRAGWLRSGLLAWFVLALAGAFSPAEAGLRRLAYPVVTPSEPGYFAVGRSSFTAVDAERENRTLTLDVWYPVDPIDDSGPFSVYDLLFAGIESDVARADVPVSREGRFPLIVFSHGSNGIRFQSFFLMETLASHGFIVVAPDHAGNTAADPIFGTVDPFPVVVVNRPLDVSFVIDVMLARDADPLDPFSGRLRSDQIGVAGHSFGAFTALAMASGFASVPSDPRVRVIVPISPAAGILSDDELRSIRIPMMVLGGTSDVTTPIDPNSVRTFALPAARPRYRVDLEKAGHSSFTNICDIGDALTGAGLPPALAEFLLGSLDEGCAPELIGIEEAHQLTRFYAVSFFQRHLAGDPRYSRFLNRGAGRSRGFPVRYFEVPGGDRPFGSRASADPEQIRGR